jgi:hypothetical protein
VPPLHPALAATLLGGFGQENAQHMADLPHTHAMLALLRDGFHPDSTGGAVELRGDGSPVLDYQVSPTLGKVCAGPFTSWPKSSSPAAPKR